MIIPAVNVAYPLLPGGATASLTQFTFLTDTVPPKAAYPEQLCFRRPGRSRNTHLRCRGQRCRGLGTAAS